ncbi:MAG: hypothetical protein SGJ10_13525 [Bacteroidota bacterium]|nr:hypothetical protein [Bacteroidota bacterium]
MGHIKEPEGFDLAINSRSLSVEEEEAVSKYIREYKAKNLNKKK